MTLIVKTVTRLTIGLILIYGIFITLHGHLGPGGGFAGGVIIALSLIHILLAFGKDVALKKLKESLILSIMIVAALVFFGLSIFNFVGSCSGLQLQAENKFALFSCGNIPLYDIAVGLMVGMGLFAIFLTLTLFRIDIKPERK